MIPYYIVVLTIHYYGEKADIISATGATLKNIPFLSLLNRIAKEIFFFYPPPPEFFITSG